MVADWIYDHPAWLAGSIIVALAVGIASGGLVIFDRLVPVSTRSRHNDVADFIIAIVGVIYAVLLAFIAVATWESFTAANTVVAVEANYVGNLFRDTIALPEPSRSEIRGELRTYLDLVIDEEWADQARGKIDPSRAWKPLERLHATLVEFHPANLGESVVQAEILRTLNDLYSARRGRLLAASDGIPPIVWWIMGLGGALTVVFSYFFGMPSFRMHLAMTGMLAASLALVFVLIVELDWPFRGTLSISPGAYVAVKENIERQLADSGANAHAEAR
jgi:Protein of unknown function (DUF4239)